MRNVEAVPAMLLFSVSTFVLFHFGLTARARRALAAGVLWVTLLLAAVLGINRLFVTEREQGGFDAFLLAPVDRTAMFVAKALVLFASSLSSRCRRCRRSRCCCSARRRQALPGLPLVLLLADAGLAVSGTLVGALAVQTRARDLIVPMLALPL